MRKYNNKSNISGKIIEQSRLEKNMSREELAEKLQLMGINIDRNHIYRIEKEIVIVKDFELIAICRILNIDYKKLEINL
jgi:transcriptional regulator, XRE family